MIIETERLILRPFQDRDREPLTVINADPETMRFFERPRTPAETHANIDFYQTELAANGFGFLATEIKRTGELAGVLGIGRFDDITRAAIPGHPDVEIGWRLRRDLWGQGLATEGALACLHYAWEKFELPEVVAITAVKNQPSRRVMEKIGMIYNAARDFDHPKVPETSPMRRHVLYRIASPNLSSA